RDRPVRHPGGDKTGDLELLRRPLVQRRGVALPCLLARGAQLGLGALLPGRRSDLTEEVGCPPEMLPRLTPLALASQPLAVEQLGASLMERRDGRLRRKRRLELLPHICLANQRPTAREH